MVDGDTSLTGEYLTRLASSAIHKAAIIVKMMPIIKSMLKVSRLSDVEEVCPELTDICLFRTEPFLFISRSIV